jgi:hypothetical protein
MAGRGYEPLELVVGHREPTDLVVTDFDRVGRAFTIPGVAARVVRAHREHSAGDQDQVEIYVGVLPGSNGPIDW